MALRSKSSLLASSSYLHFAHSAVKRRIESQSHYSKKQSPVPVTSDIQPAEKSSHTHSSSQQLEDVVLKLSREYKNRNCYIFDGQLAKKMVAAVQSHRSYPTAPVLEVQAGPGLVSQEFLAQGVSKVIALETCRDFKPFLEELKEKAGPHKFTYFHWSMMNFFRKFHFADHPDVEEYKHLEDLVKEKLQPLDKVSDPPFSIFALGGKKKSGETLNYVVGNLPNEDDLLALQGMEFFCLLDHSSKVKLENFQKSESKVSGGLYLIKVFMMVHLMYDIEFIEQFDVNELWTGSRQSAKAQNDDEAASTYYLVKLKLRSDIDDILPLHQHHAFGHFLKQLYSIYNNRLIPTLEKLVPGSGLRAVGEGFGMMDIIKTKKPERILHLYKKLITWPEYPSSPLRRHIDFETKGIVEDCDDHDLEEEEVHEKEH